MIYTKHIKHAHTYIYHNFKRIIDIPKPIEWYSLHMMSCTISESIWIYMVSIKPIFFLRFQVAKESFLTILSERVFPFSP